MLLFARLCVSSNNSKPLSDTKTMQQVLLFTLVMEEFEKLVTAMTKLVGRSADTANMHAALLLVLMPQF